jgi:hypothetical protein
MFWATKLAMRLSIVGVPSSGVLALNPPSAQLRARVAEASDRYWPATSSFGGLTITADLGT